MDYSKPLRKAFGKWLSLPNYDAVDIVASTLLANRLDGKAVWLALVGAPATGKTEIVQALSGCDRTHVVDAMTPATFASGYKSSKKDRGHHGLLDQMMDGKSHLVVVKDFSTVLQRRQDQRGEILSQMRDLYDGELTVPFGNDVHVHWEGKLGMIVCSTGQYDKEIKSLATFGDRFLVFRPTEGIRDAVAERAARNAGQTPKMRRELEHAMAQLDNIKLPRKEIIVSLEARRAIAGLADFATRARSQVPRNPYNHSVVDAPELEGPARMAVQFTQLARGSMLYFGQTEATGKDLDLLEALAFSTVPALRSRVLVAMDLTGSVSGMDVARRMAMPQSVVQRTMEDLKLLEIIEPTAVMGRHAGWEVCKQWKPYVFQMRKWTGG